MKKHQKHIQSFFNCYFFFKLGKQLFDSIILYTLHKEPKGYQILSKDMLKLKYKLYKQKNISIICNRIKYFAPFKNRLHLDLFTCVLRNFLSGNALCQFFSVLKYHKNI